PRLLAAPRDEEEAVAVRVFERDEAPAPALVRRRRDFEPARAHKVVELLNVLDREEEVYAAPSTRQRERHLREHQSKSARAQSRHRRLGLGLVRLYSKAEPLGVELHRLFEAFDFEEQKVESSHSHRFKRRPEPSRPRTRPPPRTTRRRPPAPTRTFARSVRA